MTGWAPPLLLVVVPLARPSGFTTPLKVTVVAELSLIQEVDIAPGDIGARVPCGGI
jgi:hypothetical protein